MAKKIKAFFESLIIVAILLVLIQTFLEDYAVLAGWSWDIRRILIFTGLGFDLVFSIEFFIRFFCAVTDKRSGEYFLKGRGWIDFLASVPLLVLNSGPAFFALLTGSNFFFGMGGILNILKIIKAIRIARILRLLRILKIFRQIKHAGSRMAQRHVAKITTISITTFVFTLLAFSVLGGFIAIPSASDKATAEQMAGIESFIKNAGTAESSSAAEDFADYSKDLLIIKEKGETVYSRYDNPYYSTIFGPGDYQHYRSGSFEFFFDIREISRMQSASNIMYFIIVVVSVIAFLIYYSPHFALTVTDPVHVMKRGFQEKSYNLEVEIPEEFRDDDIFVLGSLYNENYLPLKVRETEADTAHTDLSMDDLEDLFR